MTAQPTGRAAQPTARAWPADPYADALRAGRGGSRPPCGTVLVEVATVDVDERVEVHVEDGGGGRGEPFPWARLGARALRAQAADAGWTRAVTWNAAGRAFAQLRR